MVWPETRATETGSNELTELTNYGERDTENVKGIHGTIEAALAQGLYRVKCEDGRIVNASLSGVPKQTTVRVIPGDRVLLRVSDLDPTRAKILARLP